jgi:hypothetical protein
VTASDTTPADLVFGIGCDDTIEEAQQVVIQVVTVHPPVLSVSPPVFRVKELADSLVTRPLFHMPHLHCGKF